MTPHTAMPDDLPGDPREEQDIQVFLAALRHLRSQTGWGEITVTLKAGDMVAYEIKTTYKAGKPEA